MSGKPSLHEIEQAEKQPLWRRLGWLMSAKGAGRIQRRARCARNRGSTPISEYHAGGVDGTAARGGSCVRNRATRSKGRPLSLGGPA